jgi:hypothetical protein
MKRNHLLGLLLDWYFKRPGWKRRVRQGTDRTVAASSAFANAENFSRPNRPYGKFVMSHKTLFSKELF